MNKLESYYLNTVRSSKNGLCNPRIRFNWGYHDSQMNIKGSINRVLNETVDPYYEAGYNARVQENMINIKYQNNSEFAWMAWVRELQADEYKFLACAALESAIIEREYLFPKKTPRSKFPAYTWNSVTENFYSKMFAGNPQHIKILAEVFSQFGL